MGGLIDLIPGMKDFHLSRFLVGVHIAGIFLAPIGFEWLVSLIPDRRIRILGILGILGLLLPPIYQQTIRYSQFNDTLIARANENHKKYRAMSKTFCKLRSLPPARIFAGRGGGWERLPCCRDPVLHAIIYIRPSYDIVAPRNTVYEL